MVYQRDNGRSRDGAIPVPHACECGTVLCIGKSKTLRLGFVLQERERARHLTALRIEQNNLRSRGITGGRRTPNQRVDIAFEFSWILQSKFVQRQLFIESELGER